MTTYDQREQAFEAAFVHDADIRFKSLARRDQKIGLWAAGLLGKSGSAASTYADAIRATGLEAGGETAIRQRLRADFDADGIAQSDHQIQKQMQDLLALAIREVQTGT